MALNGRSNGSTHLHSRLVLPGVFAPIPAFFVPDTEELDVLTYEKHILHVAGNGVGLIISGSMGEGHHLTPAERTTLIRAARNVLDRADPSLRNVPIIAGTGTGSTKETVQLSKEAADAGADAVIVIASGYFASALDRRALKEFFVEVADKSPLPVMVYNYPGASGGIDLDSDIITELAQHPNICGVKLTCGNVGKLTRIAATTSPSSFIKSYPRKSSNVPQFLVLGGYADFLVPSIFANAHGAITGLGNVAPRTIRRLYDLAISSRDDPSTLNEAQELQGIVARADRTIALSGIAGTKYLLQRTVGYGDAPRRPLLPYPDDAGEKPWSHPHVVELLKVERELA